MNRRLIFMHLLKSVNLPLATRLMAALLAPTFLSGCLLWPEPTPPPTVSVMSVSDAVKQVHDAIDSIQKQDKNSTSIYSLAQVQVTLSIAKTDTGQLAVQLGTTGPIAANGTATVSQQVASTSQIQLTFQSLSSFGDPIIGWSLYKGTLNDPRKANLTDFADFMRKSGTPTALEVK